MLRYVRDEEGGKQCDLTLLRCFAMDSVCRAEGTTTDEGETLRFDEVDAAGAGHRALEACGCYSERRC